MAVSILLGWLIEPLVESSAASDRRCEASSRPPSWQSVNLRVIVSSIRASPVAPSFKPLAMREPGAGSSIRSHRSCSRSAICGMVVNSMSFIGRRPGSTGPCGACGRPSPAPAGAHGRDVGEHVARADAAGRRRGGRPSRPPVGDPSSRARWASSSAHGISGPLWEPRITAGNVVRVGERLEPLADGRQPALAADDHGPIDSEPGMHRLVDDQPGGVKRSQKILHSGRFHTPGEVLSAANTMNGSDGRLKLSSIFATAGRLPLRARATTTSLALLDPTTTRTLCRVSAHVIGHARTQPCGTLAAGRVRSQPQSRVAFCPDALAAPQRRRSHDAPGGRSSLERALGDIAGRTPREVLPAIAPEVGKLDRRALGLAATQ